MVTGALRITAAVTAFVAAVALGLDRAGVIALSVPQQASAVVVSAAVALVASLEGVIGERRRATRDQERRDRQERVRAVLMPLLMDLPEVTGVDIRLLGVAAYVVTGPRARLRSWLGRPARLARIERIRPTRQAVSGVTWRDGVGVVGVAVASGSVEARDLAALDARLADVQDEAAWQEVDVTDRLGLTFAEYEEVRGKYGCVLAVPIVQEVAGSQVAGAVAVDAPADAFPRMVSEDAVTLVSSAADLLGGAVLRAR